MDCGSLEITRFTCVAYRCGLNHVRLASRSLLYPRLSVRSMPEQSASGQRGREPPQASRLPARLDLARGRSRGRGRRRGGPSWAVPSRLGTPDPPATTASPPPSSAALGHPGSAKQSHLGSAKESHPGSAKVSHCHALSVNPRGQPGPVHQLASTPD